jgi:formate hydrogenlyase subunit 4
VKLSSFLHPLLALALAPLIPGVIARTKARFAGRSGQPLLQLYFDLAKLLRKGAVYSRTTSWVFRAGPVTGLAAGITALLIVPFGGLPAPLGFAGDFIFLILMLGLWRFLTMLAALDTGSSFEGMGASREAAFSALAEPVIFLALAVLIRLTGAFTLGRIYHRLSFDTWGADGPVLLLVVLAILAVSLAENARLPVDDPTTHLELTMIHEVMVLDHGGTDLAFILYASALKLWIFGALLAGVLLPAGGLPVPTAFLLHLTAIFALAVVIGLVESSMARLRLTRVPQFLVGAGVLAALALILVTR